MSKLKYIALIIIAAGLFFTLPQQSYALTIFGDTSRSEAQLGNFTAYLTYAYASSTSATLTITLANTTADGNGGYLTAFAFHNPSGSIQDAGLSEDDDDYQWNLLGDDDFLNGINAQPFGDFCIGASTSDSWQGGGNPNKGIDVGKQLVFTFSLEGEDLDLLSTESFVGQSEFFVARFRGFEGDGSDKVPGTTVPEPVSLLLFGIGLAGMRILRKRNV